MIDLNKAHDILNELEHATVAAQEELNKAVYAMGCQADFFDLRDTAAWTDADRRSVALCFSDAATAHDISHDYVLSAQKEIARISNALEALVSK